MYKVKHDNISEHSVRIPILRCGFHLVICPHVGKANDLLGFVNGDLGCPAGYVNTKFHNGCALMMMTDKVGIGEIAHESKHMVNAIFNKMGQKLDADNDEFECYLLTFICEEVQKLMNKHKKHFKQ